MKLGYSKTFPLPLTGEWEKIWAEEEFEGTLEQAKARWYAIKKEVQNFHYESKGHDAKIAAEKTITKEEDTPQSTEAKMIGDILLCKSYEKLQDFKFFAEKQKERYPDIFAAYQMMEKKLSK